jgi:hypothetical protein
VRISLAMHMWNYGLVHLVSIRSFQGQVKLMQQKGGGGLLKMDAVDAVDAMHPHLLKLDAVHPVPTKTGCSASCRLYLLNWI